MSIIDHFNLPVSNLEQSTVFYEQLLSTLGIQNLFRDRDAVGFGVETWEFGIVAEPNLVAPIHTAFKANSREQVNRFYEAALEAGGRDNGRPGVRNQYSLTYYSAYILDFDGHNIEAVCRGGSQNT